MKKLFAFTYGTAPQGKFYLVLQEYNNKKELIAETLLGILPTKFSLSTAFKDLKHLLNLKSKTFSYQHNLFLIPKWFKTSKKHWNK
jgi:hypothetical protein